MMTSRANKKYPMAVRFDCGCGVGLDGGVYCCRRHYDLVRLLHTEKWPHGVAGKGDGRSWGEKAAGRMASSGAQADRPLHWRQ